MSQPGFRLVALRLTGKEVEDAVVQFEKGLNVICGPSDTGKTFILQCINYILGGKDKPKDIPEASGYDTIHLEIATYTDPKNITLRRSLRGGGIEVTPEGEEPVTLKSQHDKNKTDNLSYYLLNLCGLAGKWLRKNKNNTKQSLSFRNIIHHCLVSEEKVIKEASPLLTGRNATKTAELSLFRLLLTGVDDSSVVETEAAKVSKIRVESKNEVLQDLIDRATEEYEDLGVVGTYDELQEQLGKLDDGYENTTEALEGAQKSVSEAETLRSDSWEKLRQVESRLNVLSELQSRFSILEKQYVTDLHRLEAIAETGARLTEMSFDRCGVCGSSAEYHDTAHQDALINPEIVSTSCVAEATKLRSLLTDLKTTQADVERELAEKQTQKTLHKSTFDTASKDIQDDLKPQLKQLLDDYREGQTKRTAVQKAIELLDRLNELEELVEEVTKKEKTEEQPQGDNVLPATGIEAFSLEVEKRLKAWNFPNTGRVTFSESDWDVVISGRRRASHGKGVRAITHAAFSLGLLGYCRNKSMPYPNFLMIDSPLVVYREPDSSDASMALDVKDAFYEDIASSFSEAQVIILENEDPPVQLADIANLISFTGNDFGRSGFIPNIGK